MKKCAFLFGLVVLAMVACGGDDESGGIAVTGLTLSATSLRLDTAVSKTETLTATLTPTDATDRTVTWKSENPSVATVDASGVVTAVAPGQTAITATSHNGGFKATCTVNVFEMWFVDDFEAGSEKWDLVPPAAGPDGTFSIEDDGSKVLKYTANKTGGVLATVKDTAWSGVTKGDYYVEARIKPLTNSTTGNKLLYLIARYQDPKNWYAAGLNVQNSSSSTQVEIATSKNGTIDRPIKVKKPIVMDTTWYTVRFELKGSTLTLYIDGELISKTVEDTAFTAGKIGLYTANKSFEIDDVRVGDPVDRPVQLTISPSTPWAAEAEDAPRVITVTAQKPDYTTGTYVADVFSVTSSDAAVVSTTTSDNTVTLAPLKPGTANITFSSSANPSLTRVIEATIAPKFVQPTTTYSLTGKTTPAAGETAAYIDTRLDITFDSAPTLGTAGSVRIFKKSDDSLVDIIRLSGEADAIGYSGQDQLRMVNVEALISVSGNTVTVRPHNSKLEYATEYYVAIADGAITNATLSGVAFNGIGKVGGWSFTTKAAPATNLTSLTVDDDGQADFRTVQGALNYMMKNAAKDAAVTIQVKNGTYQELLFLRGKDKVTIVGESRDGAIIQYKNHEVLNSGSGASQALDSGTPNGGRALFLVETSDLLTLDTLTLKNSTLRSAVASAQAETVYFNNDAGRLIAKNATFRSEQDTLQLKGYTWFYNTLVEGNVDFIWGSSHVSLFENSEIRSVGDTTSTPEKVKEGYIVQARQGAPTDKGFVFLNSKLTHGPSPDGGDVPEGAGAVTYLARSSGNGSYIDNVAFINCQMDAHIIPVGWAYETNGQPKPNPATATAASGWREYGSTDLLGIKLDLSTRVGGYTLTESEFTAGFSTRAQILSAFSGWDPQP